MRRTVHFALLVLLFVTAQCRATDLEPGLTLRLYDIGRPMERLAPLRADQTPNFDRRIDALNLGQLTDFGGPEQYFIAEAIGMLHIETPGRYEFALTSDDGARLTINEVEVVAFPFPRAKAASTGAIELAAGLHPFSITMFQNAGPACLSLAWKTPAAAEFQPVPASAFRTEKGVTRVVSPGRKIVLDTGVHMRPGDALPLESVHPAWSLEHIRPAGFEPQVGALAFLPDNRLLVATFTPLNDGVLDDAPNGTIWVLDNATSTDTSRITVHPLADGLRDPLGLAVVGRDVYVCHRNGIDRLRDLDADNTYETREPFVQPWVSDNYHHFSFGLAHHDGWLYATLSTAIYLENTHAAEGVIGDMKQSNGPNPPNRGTCCRINIESREVQFLAGGLRTPNGIEVTPDGDIFVSDNQGAWLPSSKLVHVKPGRFYGHYNGLERSARYPDGGHPSLFSDQPVSPPAVWLPQNEICNSPTTPLRIDDGPFAGQFYLGELTMGGIQRIFLEEVEGELQGAVFRHTQGLECGVNRIVKGPDDCLYIGGTGADGNWSWRGTTFGLQRLRPTGATTFEYHSISATTDGLNVRLTRPVARGWLENPANYTVVQWRYQPTPAYGGEKQDETPLTVSRALASATRDSVRLTIPGLTAGSVVYLRMDPVSETGEPMWSTLAWYTLNRIPRN